MIVFKRDLQKTWPAGAWRFGLRDGLRVVIISCPLCGARGALTEHEVDEDGNVEPSVVCSTTGCEFHEYISLEDYVASEGLH